MPELRQVESLNITGVLLFTKKIPTPIGNRNVELYQAGSPSAIIFPGSTSAYATTLTDANGYFRVSLVPGTSTFLIFSGTNSKPIMLQNALVDTTFPSFSRRNFPAKGSGAAEPAFIGKVIDTAIIQVSLETTITPTDTIGIRGQVINGRLEKEYSGMSAPAGSIIVLDTIFNLLFTTFDHSDNSFINTLYAGRKWTTVWGYNTISSYGIPSPSNFSALDEQKREIMFYYKKD